MFGLDHYTMAPITMLRIGWEIRVINLNYLQGVHELAFCRGYLAKGALFKENGRKADAQRMFIQARFYAPSEARAVVEQIANR